MKFSNGLIIQTINLFSDGGVGTYTYSITFKEIVFPIMVGHYHYNFAIFIEYSLNSVHWSYSGVQGCMYGHSCVMGF